MRMFVALYPSDVAVAHLRTALEPVRASLGGDSGADSSIRWIPPERWHITLAFLAEVDPGRLDRMGEAIAETAAQHEPLPGLTLTGAGAFGSTVWIGLAPAERGSPAERLAKAIQRAVRSSGIEVERRPWRAHLSIARIRTRDRAEVRGTTADLGAKLADYSGPAWPATEVTLVHSILGPQPEHISMGTFTLGRSERPSSHHSPQITS